jgi:hypothetical protein
MDSLTTRAPALGVQDQNSSKRERFSSDTPPVRKVNILLVSLFALVCSLLIAIILMLAAAERGATPYQMRLITAASLSIFAIGVIGTYARSSSRAMILEHEELGLLFTLGMLFAGLCLSISIGEVKWPSGAEDQVEPGKSQRPVHILSTSFCKTYKCSEEQPRKLESGQTRHTVDLNVPDVHLSYVTDQSGHISGYSIEFPGNEKNLSPKESDVLQKFLRSAIPLGAPITFGHGSPKTNSNGQ